MSTFNFSTALFKGDKPLWLTVGVLMLFSLVVLYSSTAGLAADSNLPSYHFLVKHGFFVVAGVATMIFVSHIRPKFILNISAILWLVSIALLIYTAFFGLDYNDARRWIRIPLVGMTFQPSEFAKVALLLYVARELTNRQGVIKDLSSAFVPIIVPVCLTCVLVAPSDLSTALLMFVSCLVLMFVGRVSIKYIGALIVIGLILFALLYLVGLIIPEWIRVETWTGRIDEFVNTDGGYQVQYSKMAITEGGYFGVGAGNSVFRNFLPHPYSDFVYAFIVEEYGLLGGGFLVTLFLIIIWRVFRIVNKTQMTFEALVAFGLGFMLVLQAFINMAVAVKLVPVTGLPMPFMSLGGTSLLFTAVAFGIILGVSNFLTTEAPE